MITIGEGAVTMFDTGYQWDCPGCGDAQWSATPREKRLCMPCEFRLQTQPTRSREEILAAAGTPSEFLEPFETGRVPGGWPTRHPPTHCKRRGKVNLSEWNGERWSSLLIRGNVGVGKTMLATELLWRAHQRGLQITWTSAGHYVASVFNRRVTRPIETIDALVVDDLGLGHEAPAAWNAIAHLVCERYAHRRMTIYTSNLTFEELYSTSLAVADRLRSGLLLMLRGESQR